MKAPCMDCPKRVVGCHSNCSDYIDFRQKLSKSNELNRITREYDRYQQASISNSRKKYGV